MALKHVAALKTKIAELQGMADTLQTLADTCCGDDRPDCPILADLASGGGEEPRPSSRRFGAANASARPTAAAPRGAG